MITENGLTIGYYQELQDLKTEYPETDFAFMENSEYNPYQFLHGNCDQFAMMLSQKFGYEIDIIRNNDFLIHAYCIMNFQGIKVYIDVRGMTTDKKLFFDEFADWLTMEEDGSFWSMSDGEMYEIFPEQFKNWDDDSIDLGEYLDEALTTKARMVIINNENYYKL